MQHGFHQKAIKLWAKLALFVRLYENDTKVQSSFLYDLSGGRLRSSGRLKSVPRSRLARAGSREPVTNAARNAPERFLGA
jgi:hypothetical protein